MADLTEIAFYTCLPSWTLSAQKHHTEQVFSTGPKSLPPGGRDKADFSADASSFRETDETMEKLVSNC